MNTPANQSPPPSGQPLASGFELSGGSTDPAANGERFALSSPSGDLTGRACLNEWREQEARRIAQNLHDEAGQLLSAVYIKLDLLARDLPECESSLQEIKLMLDQVSSGLRRLSHELRPSILDHLGLVPALEFLADGISHRTGMKIVVEGSTEGRLPPMVETALYRTLQEALTNAGKHSRAKRVSIRLWRDSHIHCSILDNGAGAKMADITGTRNKGGLGLFGIHERIEALGGAVVIDSAPGEGFALVVVIPLEMAEAARA